MLELQDLSLQVGHTPGEHVLLREVDARFPKAHLAAILGPSGCGKSTLLKVIAGLREATQGHCAWDGIDLAEEDMDPHEIGYVPQFSISFELLTVWESVETALSLRVCGLDTDAQDERIENILRNVGLEEIAERRVQLLSGGQRRRLALAMEIVSSPHLLLCDEVTSGLDPKAEDEIVKLLHDLSRTDERIVLSVTHSLRHLTLYDSVLVLYEGHVAYHGPPGTLLHYFNVEHPDELFARLAARSANDWHRSWVKHRAVYYQQLAGEPFAASPHVSVAEIEEPRGDTAGETSTAVEGAEENGALAPASVVVDAAAQQSSPPVVSRARAHPGVNKTPSAWSQWRVLLTRRSRLFFRDRGQLALQLALLLGFPFLVVIFALEGLPALQSLTIGGSGNFLQQLAADAAQRSEQVRSGSLVSGLIMFQVILLALIGSNNGSREIAAERLIFEKEKFAGLRPLAYVASKAVFLGVLVVVQSVWMAVFVNLIVRFPGDLGSQALLLTLVNGAMTAICLGLSSVMRTAEQASLTSIYLVGFQLPLSGAVLALPSALNALTRPLIASYWGWSGFIQTLRDTRFYEAIQVVSQTKLAAAELCVWVLASHVVLGLLIAYIGCKSSRWD